MGKVLDSFNVFLLRFIKRDPVPSYPDSLGSLRLIDWNKEDGLEGGPSSLGWDRVYVVTRVEKDQNEVGTDQFVSIV